MRTLNEQCALNFCDKKGGLRQGENMFKEPKQNQELQPTTDDQPEQERTAAHKAKIARKQAVDKAERRRAAIRAGRNAAVTGAKAAAIGGAAYLGAKKGTEAATKGLTGFLRGLI